MFEEEINLMSLKPDNYLIFYIIPSISIIVSLVSAKFNSWRFFQQKKPIWNLYLFEKK